MADKLQETSAAFAETEKGGAAMETALLLGLGAAFAFVLRHALANPLLATFTRASKVISQALSG